jgi:hypothetical protein
VSLSLIEWFRLVERPLILRPERMSLLIARLICSWDVKVSDTMLDVRECEGLNEEIGRANKFELERDEFGSAKEFELVEERDIAFENEVERTGSDRGSVNGLDLSVAKPF